MWRCIVPFSCLALGLVLCRGIVLAVGLVTGPFPLAVVIGLVLGHDHLSWYSS